MTLLNVHDGVEGFLVAQLCKTGVDRLRVSRLVEVPEAVGVDIRVLDDGSPELPDESQGDLLTGPLPEQQPTTLCPRDSGHVAKTHRLPGRRRPFAVQQLGHELGQHPDGAEQADERGAAPSAIKSASMSASQTTEDSAFTTTATSSETS